MGADDRWPGKHCPYASSTGAEVHRLCSLFYSFQFYSTEAWFGFAVLFPQPLLLSMVKVMSRSWRQLFLLRTARPDALNSNTLYLNTSHKAQRGQD